MLLTCFKDPGIIPEAVSSPDLRRRTLPPCSRKTGNFLNFHWRFCQTSDPFPVGFLHSSRQVLFHMSRPLTRSTVPLEPPTVTSATFASRNSTIIARGSARASAKRTTFTTFFTYFPNFFCSFLPSAFRSGESSRLSLTCLYLTTVA